MAAQGLELVGPPEMTPMIAVIIVTAFTLPPSPPQSVLCSFLLPHLCSDLCPGSLHLLCVGGLQFFITSSTQPRQAHPRGYECLEE